MTDINDILRKVGILQKWNLRKAGIEDTAEPAAAVEAAPAEAAPAPAKQEPPAAEAPAEDKEAAEQTEEKTEE